MSLIFTILYTLAIFYCFIMVENSRPDKKILIFAIILIITSFSYYAYAPIKSEVLVSRINAIKIDNDFTIKITKFHNYCVRYTLETRKFDIIKNSIEAKIIKCEE